MDKTERKRVKKEFSVNAELAQKCVIAATELRNILLPAKYYIQFWIQEFPELEQDKSMIQYIRRFMEFSNPDEKILDMCEQLIKKLKK